MLALASSAGAEEDRDAAMVVRPVPSLGVSLLWSSLQESPVRFGAGAQVDLEIGRAADAPPFRFFSGLRGLGPLGGALVPLETYVGGGIAASFGPWRPGLALELGLTGLHHPERYLDETIMLGEPQGRVGFYEESESTSPFFLQFEAAPLWFAVGDFRFSALEVGFGTGLGPAGALVRMHITMLRAGWAL